MKKTFILLVSLLSIFTLSGCFNEEEFEVEYYGEDVIPMGRHIQVEDFDKARRIKGYDEDKQEIIYYDDIAELEADNKKAIEDNKVRENGTDYIIYIYTTWCTYCSQLKDLYGSIDMAQGIDYDNMYFINGDTLGLLPEEDNVSEFVYSKYFLDSEDRYLSDDSEEDRALISSVNQERLIDALNTSKSLRTFTTVSYPTILRMTYTEKTKMGIYEISGEEIDNYTGQSIIRRFACTAEYAYNKSDACEEGYENEDA